MACGRPTTVNAAFWLHQLEQGEFKEFADVDELRIYLADLSEKIISQTSG
jgi:hypothetical protein